MFGAYQVDRFSVVSTLNLAEPVDNNTVIGNYTD